MASQRSNRQWSDQTSVIGLQAGSSNLVASPPSREHKPMSRLLASILFSFALVLPVAAASTKTDEARLELAVQLAALMDMDQMVGAMQQQMEAMMQKELAGAARCDAARPMVTEFSESVFELTHSELSNEVFLPKVADIYADIFAADELQELLDFYRTPLGQKMLARMPEMMERSMALAQNQMQELTPRISALAQDFGKRID